MTNIQLPIFSSLPSNPVIGSIAVSNSGSGFPLTPGWSPISNSAIGLAGSAGAPGSGGAGASIYTGSNTGNSTISNNGPNKDYIAESFMRLVIPHLLTSRSYNFVESVKEVFLHKKFDEIIGLLDKGIVNQLASLDHMSDEDALNYIRIIVS